MRVVDMRGVDLSTFSFDHDLTFAVLLTAADGHVFHRFGSRDVTGAESHLSMSALERLLRATVEEHGAYVAAGTKRRPTKVVTVEDLPAMRRRIEAGKEPECFHCHNVFQAIDEEAARKKKLDRSVIWRFPPSTRVGLRLDRDEPDRVAEVTPDSPAARGGLLAGDRLTAVDGSPVLGESDVQWALESVAATARRLPVTVLRDDAEKKITLPLAKGWREGDPEDVWRATVWNLGPRPGFGGPLLTAEEKKRLGIDAGVSAFRVQYVVTWGDHADTGRNARSAGLRKGDVVLSVAGKQDFRTPFHLHAWFRLTRKPGEKVEIVVLRGGERETLEMKVLD